MNWDNIRCFISIAEAGSLSAAAEKLSLSVATLGRRMEALEAELDLKLLLRNWNGVALTDAGERILAVARQGGEHLYQLDRLAVALKAGAEQKPIRISSTETIITTVLAPQVQALSATHPALRLDLIGSTENANLNRREADIAIRLARPKADNLVTRRLGKVSFGLFASKIYLNGRDAAAIALSEERLVSLNRQFGAIAEVEWLRERGLEQQVFLQSSSVLCQLAAVRTGAGIGLMPDYFVQGPHALAPDLVRLPNIDIPARTLWLVYHKDMKTLPEMKTVRSWIVNCCEQALSATP